MSIVYVTFAFWGASSGWVLVWKLWNWPDITKSWATKEVLNSTNYPISLLAWTTLCPAAWHRAVPAELCAAQDASPQVPLCCLSVPRSSHWHLACFKALCGICSLWKFSSDCGAACADLMASTTSLVHITICGLGSQVPLLGSFWLCCSPFPCKGAVLCISYVQRQQWVLCWKPWCSKKAWSLD